MRRLLGIVFASCVAWIASIPTAYADELEECVAAATQLLEAQGAHSVAPLATELLLEGESKSLVTRLDRQGCVGFLAVGHARVQDLDLTLHTASGIALARDVALEPYAYVRYCGAAGLELALTVTMFKGQGEYRLVSLEDAPAALPDLNQRVGGCFASSTGIRHAGADMGPEPTGAPLDRSIASATTALERLGYRATTAPMRATLGPRESAPQLAPLRADRCYALAGIGSGTVLDLDLFVRDTEGRPIARDMNRDRDAIVKLCADRDGDHAIEVRMFEGQGEYALMVLELREDAPRPDPLTGSGRIAFAETAATLRERGLVPQEIAWGLLAPGESLSMPAPVSQGECVAFAAIGSSELEEADLDLLLLDEEGALVGWNLSSSGTPMVWHCAERTAVLRLVGRVYGARGRYLAVVGRPGAGATP